MESNAEASKIQESRPGSKPKSASAADVSPQSGLTSDEARRRLEKFGPNAMPDTSAASVAHGAREILGAGSVDARGCDRARTGARQVCRGRDHRRSPGVQRRTRTVPGEPRPGDPRRAEVAARAECVRPARRRVEDHTRGRTGAGRRGEAFARRRGRRGCAPHRGRSPARPIHAHRRIGTHRSRRRRADLCRSAGTARRGGGGGHGDRSAHQVRPHRGARPHRPCRELPAEGGAARGAQSRRVQRRRHRAAGGLCLLSQDAARRDHPPRPDGGPRIDTGRAAGHLHPCGGARRAGLGKAGRPSDPPLRGG